MIDIPLIQPSEVIVLQLNITIPLVGYLLKANFNTQVYFTDPRNAVAPFPCIHTFPYDIRTGFHYTPIPNQDLLFVINEKTLIEEVNFIQQMCAYYGLNSNFYDINMHGMLDLFTPLPHLETHLAKDLECKTLVAINNQFTVSSTSQDVIYAWTLDFLKKSDIIRAVAEHHLHIVVFSPFVHNYNQWLCKFDFDQKPYPDINILTAQEYTF